MDAWASTGQSPLFLELLGIHEESRVNIPEELPIPELYQSPSGQAWVIPLIIRDQVEIDDLAKEHAVIIRRFCEIYPDSGRHL